MPYSPHTMLGPGGKLRIPVSESATLDSIIHMLESVLKSGRTDMVHPALNMARVLRDQAAGGYHRNPGRTPIRGLQFQAGTVIGQIGTDVHDIRYTHASDGKSYEHHFGGEVEVWGVQRNRKRDLLLTHVRGEPLWDEFF